MAHSAVTAITFGRVAPGICVRDIQAAHDSYLHGLGFRKVFENGEPVGFIAIKKGSRRNSFDSKARPQSLNRQCHAYVRQRRGGAVCHL